MKILRCLVWHLFLPPGFVLSDHITLQFHMVSIDCELKSSDRIRQDKKIPVSKKAEI